MIVVNIKKPFLPLIKRPKTGVFFPGRLFQPLYYVLGWSLPE
jgi:hypothetical protein